MSQYKLIIYPITTSDITIDSAALVAALTTGALIIDDVTHNYYPTGRQFLSLFSFLGCAPNISLSPEDGNNFCHVIITPYHPELRCLGHTASAIPRCPHCKKKLPQWQQIPGWQHGTTSCLCNQCNSSTFMRNLNWKREAAYGCMAVEIINIHPFEAVPSENLLALLQAATHVEWDYCYAEHKPHSD